GHGCQFKMIIRRNFMIVEAGLDAIERAAVESDNCASGFGHLDQGFDIAADTGDTGHFCDIFPVHGYSQIIGELSDIGTTRACVDQWFWIVVTHCSSPDFLNEKSL